MFLLVSDIQTRGTLTKEESVAPEVIFDLPLEGVAFKEPLKISVRAQWVETEIIAFGTIQTVISFSCSRCLEDFDKLTRLSFTQTFSPDQERIELNEEIRESILIELPINPLCKENCLGLCPMCGQDRNKTNCSCPPDYSKQTWDQLKNLKLKN